MNTRQALEIRQRLARKNPDRFEPDLAGTLANYAIRLSDAGRNEEALERARQALEIHQRLARKNPDRFAEGQFLSACSTRFMEWLADVGGNWNGVELNAIPETTSRHRYPLLKLYASFVQACCTQDQIRRSDTFRQAAALWCDLSHANKISAQGTGCVRLSGVPRTNPQPLPMWIGKPSGANL